MEEYYTDEEFNDFFDQLLKISCTSELREYLLVDKLKEDTRTALNGVMTDVIEIAGSCEDEEEIYEQATTQFDDNMIALPVCQCEDCLVNVNELLYEFVLAKVKKMSAKEEEDDEEDEEEEDEPEPKHEVSEGLNITELAAALLEKSTIQLNDVSQIASDLNSSDKEEAEDDA